MKNPLFSKTTVAAGALVTFLMLSGAPRLFANDCQHRTARRAQAEQGD
jgi:hypothetical protein